MSGSAPVQVIAAAFHDEASASIALEDLKARQEVRLGIKSAAVLRKDADGKLRIKEAAQIGGRRGAAFGGAAGAAIGLLAGPALVVPAAVGALIGGLASRAKDSGLSHEQLERLGGTMQPGSSALVAIVDQNWVKMIEDELASEGATLIVESLHGNIAELLEADHDAAYRELATAHGLVIEGEPSRDDAGESDDLIAGEDEIVGSRWIATKGGFVAHDMDENSDSE